MSRTALTWALIALNAVLVGCGAAEEDVAPAELPTAKQQAPEPPPLPKPLMRQAMHCCKNLMMEPVVKAYLALGVALAGKDLEAAGAQGATLSEALSASNLKEEKLQPLQAALAGFQGADLPAFRAAYAETSELIVAAVEPSQAGALDLAIAYSRQADAHWLQEGVEPKSPYGDGINSYSWGTREEVKSADEAREKELGNRP